MPVSKFDLYLDESGSFEKGYSFVGGLLVPSGKETQGLVETLVTTNIHASERYSKDKYPRILQSLKENGGQFVIFQNPVNTIPLPGDFVYLNIMGEGIAKLMRALGQKHPDERIELNIIAAIRKAVSYQKSSGNNSIISKNQYFTRIDEKVFFAVRRASLANVTYEFSLEDARNDKRLMLADLICYTYRKKDDASFFKDDEKRSAICKLYEPEHIYTVLEDATTQYIENQLTERNYGEAMYRLCAMKQLNEHAKTRNRLVNAIVQSDPYEQEAWFNYLSLRIGQLNRAREFEAALRLANQYKTRFLARFREHAEMKERIDYWTFDTDFYLATIYDHIGNVDKCWKSLRSLTASAR